MGNNKKENLKMENMMVLVKGTFGKKINSFVVFNKVCFKKNNIMGMVKFTSKMEINNVVK